MDSLSGYLLFYLTLNVMWVYPWVNVFHQRKLLEGTHTHDKTNPFKKMPQRTFQEDASNMYEILRSELKLILKRFMLRMEKSILFIDEIHTVVYARATDEAVDVGYLLKQWMLVIYSMQAGVNKLADLVGFTLGLKGRNVVLESK